MNEYIFRGVILSLPAMLIGALAYYGSLSAKTGRILPINFVLFATLSVFTTAFVAVMYGNINWLEVVARSMIHFLWGFLWSSYSYDMNTNTF